MANYGTILAVTAQWAAIATAGVALIAYGNFLTRERIKRIRLEAYLKQEKQRGEDRGQRSLIHLTAKLGLTEPEMLQASFASTKVHRKVVEDEGTGIANLILLEYADQPA